MWYEFKETKTYKPNNLPLINLSEVYRSEGKYELKPGDVLINSDDKVLICLSNNSKIVLYSLRDGRRKSDYIVVERTDSINEKELRNLTQGAKFNVIEPNGAVRSLDEYSTREIQYNPVQVGERLYSINGIERYIVGGMAWEDPQYVKFLMDATSGEVVSSVVNIGSSTDRFISEKEIDSLGVNLNDFYVLRGSQDEIRL